METFAAGINSPYTNHCFAVGETGIKCRRCNKVMTTLEWEERGCCTCGSQDTIAAMATRENETITVGYSFNRNINRSDFVSNTSNADVSHSNRRYVEVRESDRSRYFNSLTGYFANFFDDYKWIIGCISLVGIANIFLSNYLAPSATTTKRNPVKSSASKNPYNWQFPRAVCGDRNYSGLQNFYPVYVNKIDTKTLNYLKRNYCRDAFIIVRQKSDKRSIQVASFRSRHKAFTFAHLLIADPQVNSGEVGEPSLR